MRKHLLPILTFFAITTSVCQAQSPVLWGMTQGSTYGEIFNYNSATSQEFITHDFNGADGSDPQGSLMQASNRLIYGMTEHGGANNTVNTNGTIFSYNISTNTETVLHSFNFDWSGNDTDGYGPTGALIQASNGLLYGMTPQGGLYTLGGLDGGTIFSYNIITGNYNVLFYFGNVGDDPNGSLIQASNGLLYGVTYYTESNSAFGGPGILFSFNTSTNTETPLYNFGSNNVDGTNPTGSLIQANNGLLYGMTAQGGVNGVGTIFSYNISADIEIVLHSFGNNTDGIDPVGSLIQASNGLLYGMTSNGGANHHGIIFSYNMSNGNYADVYDFSDTDEVSNGLIQASNGLLYGTITGTCGAIFSYNISTGIKTSIYDFSGGDNCGPVGTLVEIDTPLSTSGIQETAVQTDFKLYPNPSAGYFTVSGLTPGQLIEIYNYTGQRIQSRIADNTTADFNIAAYAGGMYLVRIQNKDGSMATQKKMVKTQ